jgi:uncharacterized protein YkwD
MLSRRRATAFLAAAVAALAAPAGAQASAQDAACPGADQVPTAATIAQASQATLCLLNDERATAGLQPVAETPGLTQPSAAYSARMVAENFFAHVSPDGGTLVDRLTAARYIAPDGDWTVGENLAWGQGDLGTPRNIVIAWMNSPGHRHNILTGEFDEIGIGIALGTPGDPSWGATYTTDFGDVAGHETLATAASAPATAAPAAATAGTTAKTTKKPKSTKTAKRCATTVRGRAAKATKSAKAKSAGKGAKAKAAATTCGAGARAAKGRAAKSRAAKGRAAKTTKK